MVRFVLVACHYNFCERVRARGRKSVKVTQRNVNKTLNHHVVCVTETDLPRRVTHGEDNNRHDPDLL